MDYNKFYNDVAEFLSDKDKNEAQRQSMISYGTKLKGWRPGNMTWANGAQSLIDHLCACPVGNVSVDHARATGRAIQHFVEQGYEVADQRKIPNKSNTGGSIPDAIMYKSRHALEVTREIIIETETRDTVKSDEALEQIETFQFYKKSVKYPVCVYLILPEGHQVEPPAKAASKSDAVYMETGSGLAEYGSPSFFWSKGYRSI